MKLLYGVLFVSSLSLSMSQMEMGKPSTIKKERSNSEACADCLCTPALYGKSLLFVLYAFKHGYEFVENMQQVQPPVGLNIAHGATIALDIAIIGGIGFHQFEKSKFKKY